jgi:sugar transferase (PEP-CTERM system associated)
MMRVRGLFVPVRVVALLLGEILVIYFAFCWVGTPASPVLPAPTPPAGGFSAEIALLLAVLTILTMVAVGLYNKDAFLDYRSMLSRIALALVLAGPIIAASLFLHDGHWPPTPHGSVWLLKVVLALFACLLITRAVFLLLSDTASWQRRVVVLGAGERAQRLKQLAERAVDAHFVPVAFVSVPQDKKLVSDCALALDDARDADGLYDFARRAGASEIVIATDDRRGLPVRSLLACKARGVAVTEFLSFCERETGRVDLDALQPSWLVFSDGYRMSWLAQAVKRGLDVLVSAALLVLTLPLLVLTAIAIKLEDRGPIFYTQERVGLFGRLFTLYKFRSMRVDAEHSGPQWAAHNDRRVTHVGSFIRKVRIDELPQLLNVLKGEMSIVGPRPERPYFVGQLQPYVPFYGERHTVKPGVTGWAQINHPYGASLYDARQKLSYDLFYVKNHSLLLDLLILIQTVRVILASEGAR